MILQTVSFLLWLKDFALAEPSGQPAVMRIGDSKITVIGPKDFNCNNEQGFLPARQQCNKFYVCDPWVKLGILKTCPRGTLFDPLDLKCRKAEEVRCVDFACPNRRNRPDESDSKMFISCKSRYHPRRFRCLPEGTVYDEDIDMCIWPSLYSSQVTEISVQTDDQTNDQGVTSSVSTVTTILSKPNAELPGTLNKSDTADIFSCDADVVNLILCILLVVAICLLMIMIVIVSCLYHAYRMHLKLVQSFRNDTEGHEEIILDHTTGPSAIDTSRHYQVDYDSYYNTQNYHT